ncbi:MAG: hypothetical protein K2W95_24545 [Candidatus Obscuribacterales bacterium]|nr:hypothetical protein [Candidatus Obscuribacterales bacterium]
MPTNEPSDLPVDCTVETTQQQDVGDYRTAEATGTGELKNSDAADKSLLVGNNGLQFSESSADISGGSRAKRAHELLLVIGVSVIFTMVATTLAVGNLSGLICGFSLSGLLTAYWAYFNYRICKDNNVSTVSPMRCLAMSVFANQFGVAHAALFANSVLELIFPVLRTIRPPDLVMTFATYVGIAFVFVVVVVVAVLTVRWHIVLAKEVYGARSQASTVKALAIGCVFAATAVWVLMTFGVSDFFTMAPIAVNCCFVFVFMFARLIISEREEPAAAVLSVDESTVALTVAPLASLDDGPVGLEAAAKPLSPTTPVAQENPEVLSSPLLKEPISATSFVFADTASLPVPQRQDLTAEWLLLLTYVLTVYLSNPLSVSYGIFASFFSGVPAAVWFVYLLMETRSGSRLSTVNQAH